MVLTEILVTALASEKEGWYPVCPCIWTHNREAAGPEYIHLFVSNNAGNIKLKTVLQPSLIPRQKPKAHPLVKVT